MSSSSPHVKFEHSPADSLADSFVSTPGTAYPSLFAEHTMDPVEAMTPQSYEDDSMFGDSIAGTPAPEKKPAKKRKSWGQQLPEPKTNLPPRKRAKTEDEKEQRRVERVLRNRRAAQSSRERKRLEVEALENEKRAVERRNQDLEMRLQDMEATNLMLRQQLEKFTGNMTVFRSSSASSSPAQAEQTQERPITFSQELFSSRDADNRASVSTQQSVIEAPTSRTVNLATISPEIKPVADSTSNASSSDLTQHPAAMLCDLQCQSEEHRPWTDSTTLAISQILAITTFISMASEAISTLLSPLGQIISSLRTGSSLSPTPSILTMIIWLATTTAPLTTSTSTTSFTNTTTSLRPRFSLRIRLLRRLLACSPNLARPLMDATMVAMRLASEQQLARDCPTGVDASGRLDGTNSPTVESLMTLLWAINVIEKERLQMMPKLDAAAEVGQACGKLDELFRPRDLRRVSYASGNDGGSVTLGQKSLEGWRTAFNYRHDRP